MKNFVFFCLIFCLLAQPLFAGERVSMRAADGHPLVGTLAKPVPTKDLRAGVVLLPMYRHTRKSWQPLVEKLNRAGFTTLAIDLRGHGDSRYDADGRDDERRVISRDPALFNAMYLDAAAATAWLGKNLHVKTERMALVGASVGCSVALQAVAGGGGQGHAGVGIAPGGNYLGIATMEQITSWPQTPLLILSSEEEKDRGAEQIHAALAKKGAELRLFPQTQVHGTNMFGGVADVEDLITDWLLVKLPQ